MPPPVGEAAKAAGIDRVLSTGKISVRLSATPAASANILPIKPRSLRVYTPPASGATDDDYFSEAITQRRDAACVVPRVTGEKVHVSLAGRAFGQNIPALTSFLIRRSRHRQPVDRAVHLFMDKYPRGDRSSAKLSFGQWYVT